MRGLWEIWQRVDREYGSSKRWRDKEQVVKWIIKCDIIGKNCPQNSMYLNNKYSAMFLSIQ